MKNAYELAGEIVAQQTHIMGHFIRQTQREAAEAMMLTCLEALDGWICDCPEEKEITVQQHFMALPLPGDLT